MMDFKLARGVRQKLLLPPLGRYHHSRPRKVWKFNISIPTRSQSLILFIYFSLTFALLFVDYEIILPNYSMPRVSQQVTKFLGNRTGMMILAQLNLLALFGRRNNFLLYITNWKCDTFHIFHKWIGRVVFLLAVIHGVVESINQALKHTYIKSWSKAYFRWGAVAMILMTFIFIQSMRYFRVSSYEWFIALHIISAGILVPSLWWHISRPHDGYEFVYSFIAIWCYDRVLRMYRIVRAGGIVYSEMQTCEGNQTIKIKLNRKNKLNPFAGSYIFLYVLRHDMFWQSHPFTIADYDDEYLIVYAAIKNGITSSLQHILNNSIDKTCSMPVLVEGFYGSSLRLHHYDSIIYIAGGLGITALYRTIVENNNHQRVKLLWIIPDEKPFEWFYNELSKLKEEAIVDEFCIYLTRSIKKEESSASSSSSNLFLEPTSGDVGNSKENNQVSKIIVKYYKPDIEQLICDELSENDLGKLAFVTCGPNGISDDVRTTISSQLSNSSNRIDYFEENYMW